MQSVAITSKLTGSQCRLWLYLMLIDPFADHTAGGEIKYHDLPPIPEIAIALGSSPDTVEKDLRKLRKLGLYEYRIVTIQGHNNTAANARAEAERLKTKTKSKSSRKSRQDKDSAYLSSDGDYLSSDGDYLSLDGDYLSSDGDYLSLDGDYLSSDGDYLSGNRKPETAPDKQHSAPSDPSDPIQTLSEDERESFLEFGKKKANSLPKPPQLPIKWIKTNFEELFSQWRETQNEKENKKTKYNFEAMREAQHQMFSGQLQSVVRHAADCNDTGLQRFFVDDFNKSWFNWAKSARADVRELLANNPILQPYSYD